MDSEVKKLIKILTGRGWYEERYTGSGHIKMSYIKGGFTILPATPSDRRWLNNAWRDIEAVEKEYGPFIKPKKEKKLFNGKRGLDYIKPEEIIMQPAEKPQEVVEEKVLTIPLKVTQPEPINIHNMLKPKIPNQELIISLLTKRRDELIELLKPHKTLITELEQLEESLKNLTGETLLAWKGKELPKVESNQNKIDKFLETKPVTKSAPGVRKNIDELYKLIEEVVKANNNEMKIGELSSWMHEVHDVQPSQWETVTYKVIRYINTFNKNHPLKASLKLLPEKLPNQERVKEYTHVKYEKDNTCI